MDEQYGVANNPAYQLDQNGLESIGWSEFDQPNKGDRDWQSPDLGTFDAQTGQLVMKKTSDTNTPSSAIAYALVYSVDKIFTHRQDNWKGDPRVSVWTQHFKGDYEIEIQGSFHQNVGQVYYDVLGYQNNGTPDKLARYKINPGTNGYINVYNNQLNSSGITDYPILQNPQQNRTIRTVLHCGTALYQTFVDDAEEACITSEGNAEPKNVFNMTGWNENQPGMYITGVRFSAQKQAKQNDILAALDSVKLIEHSATHDIVDDAIAALNMQTITDTPDHITTDLKVLPDTIAGTEITWTSDHPELIQHDGTLVGLPSADTEVVMTAKITNPQDGFTKYMEFHLTVAQVNGFLETYPGSVTGMPSSAGSEGTKTFNELPMWEFSYSGISNGTSGEVHAGQVLIKDGYLTFKKISDRQTDNYNDCVVGIRSLSNEVNSPAIRSATISYTAVVQGTGTMRFAPITTDGKPVCTVFLDASVNTVDILYGEQNGSAMTQVKQRLSDINPEIEHTYQLQIREDGTFVFAIDGNVIRTERNTESRGFLPNVGEHALLSTMKVWITNITKQNTEIGKLKNFSVMDANAPVTFRRNVTQGDILQLVVSGQNIQNIASKTFALSYSADDLELLDAYAPTALADTGIGMVPGSNMTITEIVQGSLKFTLSPEMGTYTYWSGVATVVKFRAKRSAVTVITLE